MSKLAQLEGKFSWLHNSYKELNGRIHDSLRASQPLMMSAVEVSSGVPDSAIVEIKEEMDKLRREITNTNQNLKVAANELKTKISEKVDDKALNELEDLLTTDIDQTIKSTLALLIVCRFQ